MVAKHAQSGQVVTVEVKDVDRYGRLVGLVTLADGRRLTGRAVIDARGAGPLPGLDLAWQKFVGLTCRFEKAHGVPRPVIMDACVEQVLGSYANAHVI